MTIVHKHAPDRVDIAILTELKKYPPGTMREIAAVVNRSHISVKRRYEWLEHMGYITQAPNAPTGSPRSKILTQKGFELLENARNF